MLSHDTTAKLRSLVEQACGVNTGTTTEKHLKPLSFASVVIVSKESKSDRPEEVFAYAAGRPKLLSGNATDVDAKNSIYWMASFTKLVTAIACMQLVEQGKLALDDADQVERLCPELRDVKYLADDGTLEQKSGRITLRMLLTHTAGFGYTFTNEKLRDWVGSRNPPISPARQQFWNQPLVNQPGAKFEYGISLDWAGFLVERVTGTRLDEYMQRYIFEPLDIKDMSFFPDGDMKSRVLAMEQRLPDGHLKARGHAWKYALHVQDHNKPDTVRSGGAGLFGSPREYAKILAMLLNNGVSTTTGKRLLSLETVDEMFRNQFPENPNYARQYVPAAEPELVYPSDGYYGLAPPQMPQGWGLSFMISPSVTGRSDNTAHWSGMSNMFWWCDREKGVAGIVASQVLPFADPEVGKLWAKVEAAVYEKTGKL